MMNKNPVLLIAQNSRDASTDCDCACSLPAAQALPLVQPAGDWQPAPHQVIWQSGTWTALFLPQGPRSLAVLNASAYRRWQAFDRPQPLAPEDPFLEQLVAAGLLVPAGAPAPKPDVDVRADRLSAWLHLTNACNLRCDYCYLHKTSQHMTPETGRAIIDRLIAEARREGYPGIKLKYAGGEPLLNFPTLQVIQAYAEAQTAAAGLALETVLISNGTLLDGSVLAFLREREIQLAVSLDGLGASHDAQRHFANGKGSLALIMEKLDLARAAGVRPLINITISGKNADGLSELVAFLLQQGYPFTFNLYRANVFASDPEALALEERRIIQSLKDALAVIAANPPSWSLLGALSDRGNLQSPHQYACSAGRDYLVFDQNGRVAQCQMLIHQPVSDLSDATPLDTVRLASTTFASDTISALKVIPVDEKDECSRCPWRYWCAGGCPLEAKRAHGSFRAKSPNCEIYRQVFPEILKVEALRLIREAEGQI